MGIKGYPALIVYLPSDQSCCCVLRLFISFVEWTRLHRMNCIANEITLYIFGVVLCFKKLQYLTEFQRGPPSWPSTSENLQLFVSYQEFLVTVCQVFNLKIWYVKWSEIPWATDPTLFPRNRSNILWSQASPSCFLKSSPGYISFS